MLEMRHASGLQFGCQLGGLDCTELIAVEIDEESSLLACLQNSLGGVELKHTFFTEHLLHDR